MLQLTAKHLGTGYFREVYSHNGMVYKVNQDEDYDANNVEATVYDHFVMEGSEKLLAPIFERTVDGMIVMPYVRDLSTYEKYILEQVITTARLEFTLSAYDAAQTENWGVYNGSLVLRDYGVPALINPDEFESHRNIDLDELRILLHQIVEAFMLNFGDDEL